MALLSNLTNNSLISDLRKVSSSPIDSLSNLTPGSSNSTGVGRGQYEFDKYDIESLTYPSDLLGNDKTLNSLNYVIFYINVATDSRVLSTQKEQVVEGVTRNRRGAFVGQEFSVGEIQAGAAIQGAAVGGIVDVFLDNKSPVKATLLAGVGALGTELVAPSSGDAPPGEKTSATFTNPQKRLKKAIALYTPNRLEVGYGVSYEEASTFGLELGARAAKEIADAIENRSIQSLKGAAKDAATALVLGKTNAGLGIGSGRAVNPKKEQVFQGVNFRTFTFNYTFAPRSLAEAEIVKKIIYEFKYHMHPEFLNPSAFTYVYPSEFDIVYYNGPNENQYIHKHTSCVLENMVVDYTPNTSFTTFDNGMPTQINVTLTFKELLAATKETIEKGL
jgi:hypothetical protein